MNDHLVLETSYFNLVDGRRQDSSDTFRVEADVPSDTSPDGSAALYIVTEASNSGQMGSRARRMAVDTVASEYAGNPAAAAAARLRAAIRVAHSALHAEFDGHVAVGMSVIAVEGNDVYLAQVAPAQVYVLHDAALKSLPADDGASPFARAIGSRNGPHVAMFKDEIGPEDVLVLSSSWYHNEAEVDDIRSCFEEESAQDIAECLHHLARQNRVRDACAIVIEAIPASTARIRQGEPGPGFMAQVDEAVAALAGFGRMVMNELKPYDTPYRHRSAEPDDIVSTIEEDEVAAVPLTRRGHDSPVVPQDTMEMHAIVPEGDNGSSSRTPSGSVPLSERAVEPRIEREPRPTTPPPEPEPEPPVQETQDEPVSSYSEDGWNASRVLDPQDTHEMPILTPSDLSPEVTQLPDMNEEEPQPEEQKERRTRRVAPPHPIRRWRSRTPAPASLPEPEPETNPEIEAVNSRLHENVDMTGVLPPVQGFADAATTEPSRIYATSKDIEAVNRRPRRFGGARPIGKDPLDGPPVIRPGLADLNLRQPVARSAPPAVIWFSIAAVFVLAGAALYLYYQHRHHTAVAQNPYPRLVAGDLSLARTAKTPTGQDLYLGKAQHNLALAKQNGTPVKKMAQMTATYYATYDALHVITRETSPAVLADFSKYPSARLTELATGPGIAVVLDAGRKGVYSVPLNASPGTTPTQVLQSGAQVSGFTIGMPTQVTTTGSTPLILDDHNTLVRGVGAGQNATSLVQPVQTQPKIVEISNTGTDVYELDTANNQVWHYQGAVTGIDPPPQAYFTPNGPNLKTAVSLVLDGTYLYVLSGDGTALKFDSQAAPQRFDVHPRDPLRSPNLIFTDVGLNYVWIADPGTQRIVQLSKDGTFVRSYQFARGDSRLSHIDGLTVVGNTLYVLSNSRVYDFPVVP